MPRNTNQQSIAYWQPHIHCPISDTPISWLIIWRAFDAWFYKPLSCLHRQIRECISSAYFCVLSTLLVSFDRILRETLPILIPTWDTTKISRKRPTCSQLPTRSCICIIVCMSTIDNDCPQINAKLPQTKDFIEVVFIKHPTWSPALWSTYSKNATGQLITFWATSNHSCAAWFSYPRPDNTYTLWDYEATIPELSRHSKSPRTAIGILCSAVRLCWSYQFFHCQ